MGKKIRNPFDVKKDFHIVRAIKFDGEIYRNGIFPWKKLSCSVEHLYRFWELRYLECDSAENIEGLNTQDLDYGYSEVLKAD